MKKKKNFSLQKVLQSSPSSNHMISQKLKIFCMCDLLAAVGQGKDDDVVLEKKKAGGCCDWRTVVAFLYQTRRCKALMMR